jgi:hypothetical protein
VGEPAVLQFRRIPSKLSEMSEYSELLDRIDAQRRRALAVPQPDVRDELEDLLTEGYLVALTGESRSRRLSERLDTLAQKLDQGAAIEARLLAREKRTVDQRVRLLRDRLAELRACAVGGSRIQPS